MTEPPHAERWQSDGVHRAGGEGSVRRHLHIEHEHLAEQPLNRLRRPRHSHTMSVNESVRCIKTTSLFYQAHLKPRKRLCSSHK